MVLRVEKINFGEVILLITFYSLVTQSLQVLEVSF